MMGLLITFMVNAADLFILMKYMSTLVAKRKTSFRTAVVIFIITCTGWSYLNQYHNMSLNLLTSIVVVFLFSLQYACGLLLRMVLLSMYMSVGFVTEPLCLLMIKLVAGESQKNSRWQYYFLIVFGEVLRFCIVQKICSINRYNIEKPPREISYILIIIPIISILNCCLVIISAMTSQDVVSIFMCIAVIITIVLSNYYLFNMFEKFNDMTHKQHEDDLFIQEMRYKENYYCEVQESNERVQNIKHDLKNQLSALYDSISETSDAARSKLKEIFHELDITDSNIYTENAILNSVLKIKLTIARDNHIDIEVIVQVPKEMNLDYGDIGILYGNLLDNAIEACQNVEPENRKIILNTKFIENTLILVLQNSKTPEKNESLETRKKDKNCHGRGIKSVRRVIEKYNGNIKFEDHGNDFEVIALLYGIYSLN